MSLMGIMISRARFGVLFIILFKGSCGVDTSAELLIYTASLIFLFAFMSQHGR
jgi:hypothetical protein